MSLKDLSKSDSSTYSITLIIPSVIGLSAAKKPWSSICETRPHMLRPSNAKRAIGLSAASKL